VGIDAEATLMDPRLYHRPRIEWWQLRRRWRRWRDDLQHHAAPIRRSHWQSVVLASMWGSLAIAPVVAIVGHLAFERTTTESFEARFHRLENGRWVDASGRDLDDPTRPVVDLASTSTTFTSGVTVTIERKRVGWPAASGRAATGTMVIKPLSPLDPSETIWPGPNPNLAQRAVVERNRIDWAELTGETSISVMSIVVNALVAWPIVFALAWLCALVVRAAQLFVWRRRARIETGRADQGLCPGCGHIVDRAGFSDRCPECGYFLHRR